MSWNLFFVFSVTLGAEIIKEITTPNRDQSKESVRKTYGSDIALVLPGYYLANTLTKVNELGKGLSYTMMKKFRRFPHLPNARIFPSIFYHLATVYLLVKT